MATSDHILRQYVDGRDLDDHIQILDRTIPGDAFKPYYYHCNSQGSVGAITDEDGDIAEYYRYSWTGAPTVLNPDLTERSNSVAYNFYGFQGRRFDADYDGVWKQWTLLLSQPLLRSLYRGVPDRRPLG